MTWYNSSYLHKKALTIDHTKVSGASDLSSFPVLISRTDTDLKTTGNGGSVQNSSGYDIIFTPSTEDSKLDHEIESYTASSGAIVMWVRIPTLSHTADTVIYMYYDNSSISTSQENKTGVWDSNYKAVWHLKEDPSGTAPQMKDSTSTANNASSTGSMASGGQVAGEIDGSLTFASASSQNLTTTTDQTSGPTNYTLEVWFKTSSSSVGMIGLGANQTGGMGASDRQLYIDSGGHVKHHIYNGGDEFVTTGSTYNDNTWHYAAGILSSSAGLSLILDGSTSVGNGSYTVAYASNSHSYWRLAQGFGLYMNGGLDEIRFSNVARSSDWILTCYNSESSPSTFYSVGSVQNAPSGTALSATLGLMGVG